MEQEKGGMAEEERERRKEKGGEERVGICRSNVKLLPTCLYTYCYK